MQSGTYILPRGKR